MSSAVEEARTADTESTLSWRANVNLDLAREMYSEGFDCETIPLLCPAATRKEEVEEALAGNRPAQGGSDRAQLRWSQ